jgi:uncharacterized protein YndB with AHSA1/START domain
MTTTPVNDEGYAAEVAIAAPPDRVFEALITLDGLAGWWTPTVSGHTDPGGQITFHFANESVVMRVDQATPPISVVWTCLSHSKFPEWRDTTLAFEIRRQDAGFTLLAFRHVGLVAGLDCYSLCSAGWDHYLRSLAAHVVGDGGSPWGTPTWRPATPLIASHDS